jgi:hypothetical protein
VLSGVAHGHAMTTHPNASTSGLTPSMPLLQTEACEAVLSNQLAS